jgi:hypothetical protein
MSARVIACDHWLTPSRYCCGDAETSGQLPSSSGRSMPSHATRVEPLAPAWPSWSAIFASVFVCTKSTMRFQPSRCVSFHRPGQPGVMRASGDTHVISATTMPAPPMARAPEVRQVVVAGDAVDARVLRHRRDDDAVLQRHAAPVYGVNIGGIGSCAGWRFTPARSAIQSS